MKREFNTEDIAHLSKNKRLRGILNKDTDNEAYKDFTLKYKDEVVIVGYSKADEKVCGGFVYECEVEHKNIKYIVECISQFELIPKKMWEQLSEMERKIKELEALKG